MSEAKEPRTAQAGSLLAQWWTLGTILTDKRTAGRHASVSWVIIDRYMQRKGNGRASARYISKATGLGLRHVVRACQELTEWGYFEQHVGTGTRPTEYTPKWSSVSPMGNAKQDVASVSPMVNTSVSPMGNTTGSSVSPMGNESYLPEPADKAELQVGRNMDTPAPPPTAGLSAAVAGARDPFEQFWSAYPRKHQRSRAEAAWTKIAPDADVAEEIIAGAQRLADHYAEHPVEKKWMKLPANWLAGKGWTEDLPDVHGDAKQAASAKKASGVKPEPVADNDDKPAGPRRWGTMEIVNSDYVGGCLSLVFDNGTTHNIYLEHDDFREQDKGQRELASLCKAAGINQINDSSELHKAVVTLSYIDGELRFSPAEQEAA